MSPFSPSSQHCLSFVNQPQERSVAKTLLIPLRNLLQSRCPPALQLRCRWEVCTERRSGCVLPSTEFSALCCENPAATVAFGRGGLVVEVPGAAPPE